MSPNFHINDFGTPISPPTAVINNIYISVNIEKIKIFLDCWKEMMKFSFRVVLIQEVESFHWKLILLSHLNKEETSNPDCYVTKIYVHQSPCETSFKI